MHILEKKTFPVINRKVKEIFLNYQWCNEDFPGDSSDKEPTCQCRKHKRCRFNPRVGKIPWRRKWHAVQYSCLENLMGRGAWRATVPWGSRELDMTEWLGPCTDIPGGAVGGNPPAGAGDWGSIPGLGRFPVPWSNWAHASQRLSLCARVPSPRAADPEARSPGAAAPQQEKTAPREACAQHQGAAPAPSSRRGSAQPEVRKWAIKEKLVGTESHGQRGFRFVIQPRLPTALWDCIITGEATETHCSGWHKNSPWTQLFPIPNLSCSHFRTRLVQPKSCESRARVCVCVC